MNTNSFFQDEYVNIMAKWNREMELKRKWRQFQEEIMWLEKNGCMGEGGSNKKGKGRNRSETNSQR